MAPNEFERSAGAGCGRCVALIVAWRAASRQPHGAGGRRVGSAGSAGALIMRCPRAGAFIAQRAAIPENMLEAMLFGYERGLHGRPMRTPASSQASGNCCSTKSPRCRSRCRPVTARAAGANGRLAAAKFRSTCASSPPPTGCCAPKSPRAASAKIYYRLNVFPWRQPLRERRDDISRP